MLNFHLLTFNTIILMNEQSIKALSQNIQNFAMIVH